MPFFLYSMLLFLKLYGLFTNCNKSEIISDEIPCFALKICLRRVWRFFWCILTLLPLTNNSQKRESWESYNSLKALPWHLLSMFSMFLLLKQKLHGFIKKYFREGPANGMSSSTSISLSTSINGISHSSIKSKTISSIGKPCDWFLALGFW